MLKRYTGKEAWKFCSQFPTRKNDDARWSMHENGGIHFPRKGSSVSHHYEEGWRKEQGRREISKWKKGRKSMGSGRERLEKKGKRHETCGLLKTSTFGTPFAPRVREPVLSLANGTSLPAGFFVKSGKLAGIFLEEILLSKYYWNKHSCLPILYTFIGFASRSCLLWNIFMPRNIWTFWLDFPFRKFQCSPNQLTLFHFWAK